MHGKRIKDWEDARKKAEFNDLYLGNAQRRKRQSHLLTSKLPNVASILVMHVEWNAKQPVDNLIGEAAMGGRFDHVGTSWPSS